jgi:hypothetical protein
MQEDPGSRSRIQRLAFLIIYLLYYCIVLTTSKFNDNVGSLGGALLGRPQNLLLFLKVIQQTRQTSLVCLAV